MPETDIILGDDDVEVRAADLAVFNSDGDSTIHADWMYPSTAISMASDDGDRSLQLTVGSLTWQKENDRSLRITPESVRLPFEPGDGHTSVIADVVNARTEFRSGNAEIESGHFVEGTFGGNPWGTEEPQAGRVEVLDDQGNQAVLLDGSRGVVETTGGDVAEYFPNGTDRTFDAGEVVGLEDGAVVGLEDGAVAALDDGAKTDAVADCDEAFVVASSPMLLGNRPPEADSAPEDGDADHVPLALLGQVPVRVAADVKAGDCLVATVGGRAVPAAEGDDGAPTVGRALESAPAGGEASALVGYSTAARDERDDRIDELESETESLRAENEALRERLAAVEERLAADEDRLAAVEGTAETSAAPADD